MFWKKKKMIDVNELQKRGIRLPIRGREVVTNREGFIEIDSVRKKVSVANSSPISGGALGFMDVSSSDFSNETENYSKREIDAKIEKLDSLIYKLEQRIEVLERKVGVGSPVGGAGW